MTIKVKVALLLLLFLVPNCEALLKKAKTVCDDQLQIQVKFSPAILHTSLPTSYFADPAGRQGPHPRTLPRSTTWTALSPHLSPTSLHPSSSRRMLSSSLCFWCCSSYTTRTVWYLTFPSLSPGSTPCFPDVLPPLCCFFFQSQICRCLSSHFLFSPLCPGLFYSFAGHTYILLAMLNGLRWALTTAFNHMSTTFPDWEWLPPPQRSRPACAWGWLTTEQESATLLGTLHLLPGQRAHTCSRASSFLPTLPLLWRSCTFLQIWATFQLPARQSYLDIPLAP